MQLVDTTDLRVAPDEVEALGLDVFEDARDLPEEEVELLLPDTSRGIRSDDYALGTEP